MLAASGAPRPGGPVPTGPTPSGRPTDVSQFDLTEARKQWQVVLRRFLRHRLAVLGMVVFATLFLLAFAGGPLWIHDYKSTEFLRYSPPSGSHPFGTDGLGADMVAQVLRGTRFSLQIAIIVALLSTAIGVTLGAIAGYKRGWVDSSVSRFIDLVLVIPHLVIVVVLARSSFTNIPGSSNSNWQVVTLYMALVLWMQTARVVRGMVLSLREKEFVEAAKAMGGSTSRIVFKHILPNTVDVIIVNATLAVATAVLLEAAISFIGLGVRPPDTSLGLLINQNKNELTLHPWLFFIPFAVIISISLAVNFIGDGLRDALDPRQRRVRA